MTRRYISSKSSLVLVVVLAVVFSCPFIVVVSKIGGGGGGATVVGLHRRWLFFRVLGPCLCWWPFVGVVVSVPYE